MNENPHYESSGAAEENDDDNAAAERDDPSVLSPAVRRLVKAYELDVTAIRGSGPSGRIRVGDVMAALGHRAAPAAEDGTEDSAATRDEPGEADVVFGDAPPAAAGAPAGGGLPHADRSDGAPTETAAEAAPPAAPERETAPFAAALPRTAGAPATTVVFECDLGSVLSHRQRERASGVDVSLTAYFVAACAAALREVPEANAGRPDTRVAVHRLREAGPATHVVADADRLPFDALSAQLSKPVSSPEAGSAAAFGLRSYGDAGAVLALPVPLEPGGAAALGVGKPRRQIVLRNVDGQETPRASASCFLSLSYDPALLDFPHASRFVAEVVGRIERWPQN